MKITVKITVRTYSGLPVLQDPEIPVSVSVRTYSGLLVLHDPEIPVSVTVRTYSGLPVLQDRRLPRDSAQGPETPRKVQRLRARSRDGGGVSGHRDDGQGLNLMLPSRVICL
eukprot:SAG22_NODE_2233_length_2809_cov_7.105166_1_plen_111_part_10